MGNAGHDVYMLRNDSITAAAPVVFDATLSVSNRNIGIPENLFGFAVTKIYIVGVAPSKVGFLALNTATTPASWVFVGPTYTFPGPDGTTSHRYRLRKFGADSAVLRVDGARVLRATAGSLTGPGIIGATALFGTAGLSGTSASTWASAAYTIGLAASGCS
jgi:hypothetical protein